MSQDAPDPTHTRDQTAAAIARIPSGVAILTASHQGRSTGLLASWFQQASFEPLMVVVCVRRGRPIEKLIDASGMFLLNLLGRDPKKMFKHFGRGFEPDQDAFENLDVRARDAGVQLVDAIAHVGCKVASKVDSGDHVLYLGEALGGQVHHEGPPHVHLRRTALKY